MANIVMPEGIEENRNDESLHVPAFRSPEKQSTGISRSMRMPNVLSELYR